MSESKDNQELDNRILETIRDSGNQGVEVNEIQDNLGITSSTDFKELVKQIAELERKEEIELTQRGKFIIKDDSNKKVGKFSGTDRGFGFVMMEDETDDIFIPADNTKMALNGDMVAIEITESAMPWKNKAAVGKVTEIIERGITNIIGEFHKYDDDEASETGYYGYVIPNMKKFPNNPIQITQNGLSPVQGEIVQVDITQYPRYKGEDMQGLVKSTIGHKDEPGVEILAIVHKHGIPSEFPEEVIEESKQVPDQIAQEDIDGRCDLRDEVVITIDGADAKDLDDAVTVKKLDNGNYKLGVHIADVSHYVREGTAMDQEAFERGTSSYLTDRVIPMLPQRLSNGICSLHPNVDRLTLSCEMEIDSSGDVVNYDIFKSVIKSKQRMTYEAVNNILMNDDEETKKEYESLVPMFYDMRDLHDILENMRKRRGAIDFDTPEAQIIVDEEGTPTDIQMRERGVGERLIESFMLQANETVSEHFEKKHLPILYRVHENPDEAKVQTFLEFVTSFGINVTATKDTIRPKDLQKVLAQVKGEAEETVISMLLLRSMQQARYDVDALGHFGLAAEYYSHFTSPIRRYPDLILHRLIHYYDEVGRSEKDKKYWEKKLPDIAEQSSMAERRAIDAERETDELKKAEYMQAFIGEEFTGTIVSITGFGMFIQLPNSVEGLIHITKLDDDYYEFNERSLVLVGTRTGKVFRIGQPIKVQLSNVNLEQVEIDFEIIEDFAEVDKSLASKSKKKQNKKPKDHKRPRGNRNKNGGGNNGKNKGQSNGNNKGKSNNNNKENSNQGGKRNFKIKKRNKRNK